MRRRRWPTFEPVHCLSLQMYEGSETTLPRKMTCFPGAGFLSLNLSWCFVSVLTSAVSATLFSFQQWRFVVRSRHKFIWMTLCGPAIYVCMNVWSEVPGPVSFRVVNEVTRHHQPRQPWFRVVTPSEKHTRLPIFTRSAFVQDGIHLDPHCMSTVESMVTCDLTTSY